jgi:hypothetical protein
LPRDLRALQEARDDVRERGDAGVVVHEVAAHDEVPRDVVQLGYAGRVVARRRRR